MSGDGETGQQGDEAGGRPRERPVSFDRVVREAGTALLDESDPGDIQAALVDELATTGLYSGVWVGTRLDRTATRAYGAGPLVDVLGEIATLPEETDGFVRTDGLTVVPVPIVKAIAADVGVDVDQVMAVRVPLQYRGLANGMLVVATTRSDAFEATERAALYDLGRFAAFALDAASQRSLLAGRGCIEAVMETRHDETPTALTVLAGEAGDTVELERAIPREDAAHLHVTVPDPEFSLSSVTDHDLIRRGTVRRRESDSCTVELVVSPRCPIASLAASGVVVESALAEPDRLRVTVRGGETGPEILRQFQAAYPTVTCVAKRQLSADGDHESGSILSQADLTRKQETVLEAALAGGFFERPRERTGAEIADSLDISASTFHQHLREALRKVVEAAVGGET